MNDLIEINNDFMEIYYWLGEEILKVVGDKSELFEHYVETLRLYKAMAIQICCEANAVTGKPVWGVTIDNRVVAKASRDDAKGYMPLE